MARNQPSKRDPLRRDLVAVALATLGALILVSLLLSRSSEVPFFWFVAEGLRLAFGYGAYLVAALCMALAFYYALEKTALSDYRVLSGVSLLFLVVIVVLHLPRLGGEQTVAIEVFSADAVQSGGGYLGAALAWSLYRLLGPVGSYILIVGVVLAASLLITQVTARELFSQVGSLLRGFWVIVRGEEAPRPARARRSLRDKAERTKRQGRPPPPSTDEPRVDLRENGDSSNPGATTVVPEITPPSPEHPSKTLPAPVPKPKLHLTTVYQRPSLELLQGFDENPDRKEMQEETAERIITLEDTLESFGISAKVTHYERGPVLTRYEVEPERGIRVSQITRLADDLAMNLAAVDVRVEAPIPGKSAIGIEVPNEQRAMVSLRSVLESSAFGQHRREELPLALGRDIAGQPVIADLVAMPHLLIAGATGSGKSVCLHSVILSLVMTHSPGEVRLIIVDPKRVEMAVYDGIPHLLSPVVHSVSQAASVLRKAIKEMEKRYDKFALKGVVNLSEYNDLARLPKESILEEFEPLPRVIIIIDELADLMIQARAEFEYSICRLAQLARATGIHLVIATQRPSVKVITGNIKANMPSRIAMAVASIHDSRTVLDGQGAERLIGQGDMLYAPIEAPKPRRVQGSFVPREDLMRVAEFLREQGEPDFQIVPDRPEGEEDFNDDLEASDELYAAAVQYVVQEQMASVSMLQRRFKVGYARAGRLIDLMERRGVVGPHEGSKPRQVLVAPGHAYAARGESSLDDQVAEMAQTELHEASPEDSPDA